MNIRTNMQRDMGIDFGGVLGDIFTPMYNNWYGDTHQVQQQRAMDEVQVQANANNAQAQYGVQNANYAPNDIAQVQGLRAAGLNPALMYSGKGGGGMTQPGGIQGGQANTGMVSGGMLGLQIGSQQEVNHAQAEELKADAAKKRSDTPTEGNTGDVQVHQGEAETKNIIQKTGNLKTDQLLTEAQIFAQNIANGIQRDSADSQVQTWHSKATEAMNQAIISGVQAGISESTVQDSIDKIKADAIGSALKNSKTTAETQNVKANTDLQVAQTGYTKQNTALSAAQTEGQIRDNSMWLQRITQMVQQTGQGWESLDIQHKNQIADQAYKEGLIDLGNKEIFMQAMDAILTLASKTGGRNPIGFKR